MARMIPPHWHDKTPRSEQRVFNLLKHDPLTESWTVLHSLNLKQSGTRPYGEVDFVVLIPSAGIICLEVKGGRVACKDGIWTSTDAAGTTSQLKRSPFAQAQDGMHELRKSLGERLASTAAFNQIPFGFAVIFTDVDAPPADIGTQPWEIIDDNGLRRGLGSLLLKAAKQQRVRHRYVQGTPEPQPQLLRTIINVLRPDFERIVARGTIVGDSERRLLKLTEEQYDLLDLLGENPRCLFEGAAGTGKTLLALEFARRRARTGERVLLICYNKLLGDWFEKEIGASTSELSITAGRFYKCLREVILRSSIAQDFLDAERDSGDSELFDAVYPLYGQLVLEAGESRFDVVVMDEAQDLLHPSVLNLLDSWVEGGLREGRWAFFGDFHRQAIYGGRKTADPHEQLLARQVFHVRATLKQNCRNTRRIGEETALLSGFESPPYRMGQVDGAPVDYIEYSDEKSQVEALDAVLKRLCLEPDITPDDIIVLSRYRFEQSIAGRVPDSPSYEIRPVDTNISRHRVPTIRFATVQAFKGMESKVVVLCDIERIEGDDDRSLLYVAMSRARSLLTVLLHVRTKGAVKDAFKKRLSDLWR